jgi:adenylate cyclase
MVNTYLETMTEIILKHQGTIDEFIGDGILVIFGAPLQQTDDARRAVACAVDMQLAIASVNDRNRQAGYPEVALGIGVNTGKMVVGNIGSKKRTKYGVVGRNVNLTARIESYTVGGQIFISESTLKECGDIVQIDSSMEIMPKGVKKPLTIYEVGGIAGGYQLFLPPKPEADWIGLAQQLPIEFNELEGKNVGNSRHKATIIKLVPIWLKLPRRSCPRACQTCSCSYMTTTNVSLLITCMSKYQNTFRFIHRFFQVNFTAIPPEAETFLAESLDSTGTS